MTAARKRRIKPACNVIPMPAIVSTLRLTRIEPAIVVPFPRTGELFTLRAGGARWRAEIDLHSSGTAISSRLRDHCQPTGRVFWFEAIARCLDEVCLFLDEPWRGRRCIIGVEWDLEDVDVSICRDSFKPGGRVRLKDDDDHETDGDAA